ncbi:tetraacyldisaccharide 4'-kinase [Roseibium salinum]|nr:tetraacyldisaccharide 4'-kinase [Roseibium salinum]
MGYDVKRTRAFADHHIYTESDVRDLLTEAEEASLQLVTTAKDMARLETADGELFHWISSTTHVLDVRMEIDDEDRLMSLIRERLKRRKLAG